MLLNESCTAKMLTHLRDSIHSDPESGLLYWVSRVYDDKDLSMTMCDRVLILPNEKILASSAQSVPAGEVNRYPRLDLQLRPTRVPQLNEVSYGEEYEEGLEGPTSPRVIEKLRGAKEFYGDVLAEFRLSVHSPVIDHRVPLTHNEAMTLPSADL